MLALLLPIEMNLRSINGLQDIKCIDGIYQSPFFFFINLIQSPFFFHARLCNVMHFMEYPKKEISISWLVFDKMFLLGKNKRVTLFSSFFVFFFSFFVFRILKEMTKENDETSEQEKTKSRRPRGTLNNKQN